MKTIDEIQVELRALARELEQLKKREHRNVEQVDFAKMASLGARYPITPHPLSKCDSHTKKCYLVMLLSVTQYAGEQLEECLLLANRIAFGMGYLQKGETLKEEYLAAQTVSFEQLNECTALFQNNENRLMLMLELLLTAGLMERGKRDALEYLSRMCVMLKISIAELKFLSNMAAVVLTRDLTQYHCDIRNTYTIFDGYLKEIAFKRDLFYLPVDQIPMAQDVKSFTGSEILSPLIRIRIHERAAMTASYTCEYYKSFGVFSYANGNRERMIVTREFTAGHGQSLYIFSSLEIEGYVGDGTFFKSNEEAMKKWDRIKRHLIKKIHKPIGVETHPLDSKALAQAYFEAEKGAKHDV